MKKTKKLLSLLLVPAMCALLAACGGSDGGGADLEAGSDSTTEETFGDSTSDGPTDEQLSALTEAYQEVSPVYLDAVAKAQENGWEADEQTMSELNVIGTALDPVGQALNGDMSYLEGADFDDLIVAVQECLPASQTLLERVSEPYEGGGDAAADEAVVTDEALKPLANAYNELANIYNEVYTTAEANGWLADEQTSAELDAVYATVTYTGSGLTDDPSKLEDADLDGLTQQLEELIPEMEAIGERVSVPYGGER